MLDVLLSLLGLLLLVAGLTWLFPALLRPVLWPVAHLLYRLRVHHRERIPATGGGLIVCNHVSYVDWLVLWVACPRPVTFVLWGGYYRNPILRFFLSWVRNNTVRVDERTNRPHAVAESLGKVAAALDAGRLVVVFPEGRLTLGGNMLPFGRGIERVLKLTTADVPVIPTCTSGLFGGFFSHGGGPILRKLPKALRPRVGVWFGEPLLPSPRASRGEGGEAKQDRAAGAASEQSRVRGDSEAPLTPDPSPRKAGARGGILSAADIRLAVQEAVADLAIRDSDYVPLVHRAFVRNAAKFRNIFRPCVIDNSAGPARTLTWGKTLVGALCVTNFLRSRVGDAANVGVWLPTSLGGALANLAVAFLHKASVNLNYTAGAAPVRSAIQQAGIRVVVTSKRFVARVPLELPEGVEPIYLEDVLESVTKWQRISAFLKVLLLPGWVLERMLGLHRHTVDDVLTIVFSSGSTGEPKGVVLTHRNVGHNADSSIRTIGIAREDRLFGILPFFHSFGYTVCLWAPLAAGCIAVYYPDPRAAKEVGELARTHRVTIMLATATFVRFYLRRCDKDDFHTVRVLVCGAEKLPVKLQDEFREKFGILPFEGYGCTELSPVVSTNLPDIQFGGEVQERNHRGTVGQPIFGVCVKAFTIDDARTPLPIGEEGVLCVKGPNVMAGYLHQPEKTADVVRGGWYNTGDVGHVEPDGFVRITGRVSRFAKIAGEMVPLERLDDEMQEILATGGDRVLAVAAVPDEKRGERLIVLYLSEVEPKLTDLLAALPKRGIPNLWVPDCRDCYPVEAMPVLGSGKLDLKKLGDLAKELSGR
jgi:acyl-[acyl-carrier-protein]-phospholipid O-acyltransferase/long-chain-fatty-acid--[acyl-carrier-protein] ligase